MRKNRMKKELLFFAALLTGMIISLLLPLRPAYSATEKRTLTKWPSFQLESFLDGTYYKQVDLWFSDTFPFRDQLTTLNASMKQYYGFHTMEIYGDNMNARQDEIPDIPSGGKLAGGKTAEDVQKADGKTAEEIQKADKDAGAKKTDDGNAVGRKNTDSENSAGTKEADRTKSQESEKPVQASDVNNKVANGKSGQKAKDVENLGSLFITGGVGYSYYYFTQKETDQYIGMLNSLAGKLEGKAKVYDVVVPTAIDLTLDPATRNKISSSNQEKALDYMYYNMEDTVNKVNVFQNMKKHSDEYIYFKTDHHWTALGAYYAYETLMESMGKTPHALSDFETMKFDNFHGSYYSESGKAASLENVRDTITAYIPMGTNKMKFTNQKGEKVTYQVVANVKGWNENSLYSAFIGGDNPLTVISNPKIKDGSSCLLVKESFGNAFAPFLVDHYQYVYVVDYRYYNGTVSGLVNEKGIDDVIIMNNIAAVSTASRLKDMETVYR
ncbi:MAG: DHHW family protein [Lachnospiraceae bacterium]|nr:DHHW family protein [Lachnospiraceae bacterium]